MSDERSGFFAIVAVGEIFDEIIIFQVGVPHHFTQDIDLEIIQMTETHCSRIAFDKDIIDFVIAVEFEICLISVVVLYVLFHIA